MIIWRNIGTNQNELFLKNKPKMKKKKPKTQAFVFIIFVVFFSIFVFCVVSVPHPSYHSMRIALCLAKIRRIYV